MHTKEGVGFILTAGEGYRPTYDLAQNIVHIRRLVACDSYEPQSVSLGSSMPDIMFRRYSNGAKPEPQFERGTELADTLAGIRRTAAIVARLRPEYHNNHQDYSVLVELIECSDDSSRQFLCQRLDENPTLKAVLHVSHGPLMCAVHGIAVRPADAYESTETLKRFAQPLMEILRSAHKIKVS